MKVSLFLFLFICCFLGKVYPQVTATNKVLSREKLLADYEIVYSSLINYHPNPFLYINEKDFFNFYNKQKTSFPDSLTELEFHLVIRQLIAKLKCGHTYAKPSDDWYASLKGQNILLPFDIKSIGNKFYISNTINEEFDFNINDELISINRVSIGDIIEQLILIQEKDGNTTSSLHAIISKKFRTYYLFLFGFQEEFIVEYRTASGEIQQTKVLPTNRGTKIVERIALPSNFTTILDNKWSLLSYDSLTAIAILKINSFNDRKEFKKYYKSVFLFLSQFPKAQLVIDLRDNSGGYFGNGNHFLTYLTPRKFDYIFIRPKQKITKNKYTTLDKWSKLTKMAFSIKPGKNPVKGQEKHTFSYKPNKYLFQGKTHVITNGITFSLASLAAAQLQEYGAVFYGEETGGAEKGTNAMLNYILVLPNSKIKVIIAHYQVISNSTAGKLGFGVKPKYPISPTLNTLKDESLETVLSLIRMGN